MLAGLCHCAASCAWLVQPLPRGRGQGVGRQPAALMMAGAPARGPAAAQRCCSGAARAHTMATNARAPAPSHVCRGLPPLSGSPWPPRGRERPPAQRRLRRARRPPPRGRPRRCCRHASRRRRRLQRRRRALPQLGRRARPFPCPRDRAHACGWLPPPAARAATTGRHPCFRRSIPCRLLV